jgi:hypothetical protein
VERDQLVRYPNVYADNSGVRRFDYIVQAVARAGAKKVIFGSDGPWLHPGLELHQIASPAAARRILDSWRQRTAPDAAVRVDPHVAERTLAIKRLTRPSAYPSRETRIDRYLPPIEVEHEL